MEILNTKFEIKKLMSFAPKGHFLGDLKTPKFHSEIN